MNKSKACKKWDYKGLNKNTEESQHPPEMAKGAIGVLKMRGDEGI